ncbi:hypothetical protein MKW98_018231, partial [Papaver atlanticum]
CFCCCFSGALLDLIEAILTIKYPGVIRCTTMSCFSFFSRRASRLPRHPAEVDE